MHVEIAEGGSLALHGHPMGAFREFFQFLHVLCGKQLALVGPPFDAGGCTHAQETPTLLKDFQAVAVLDGGDGGRLKGDIAANFEDGGADKGFSESGCMLGTIGARSDQQRQTRYR